MEQASGSRHQNFMSEAPGSRLLLLTDTPKPRLQVTFGGADAFRDPLEILAEDFVAVKGFKAKGKRVTTCQVDGVVELESISPEPEAENPRRRHTKAPTTTKSPYSSTSSDKNDNTSIA